MRRLTLALDQPGSYRLALGVVLATAALARLLVILPGWSDPPADPDNYLPLARSIAEGRGLEVNGRPTAYRPPLYPLILAPIVALDPGSWKGGVAALHLLLGLGSVGLSATVARRWGLGRRSALAAAALTAFDPVLIVQARSVMTETLAAFLVAATLGALTFRGATGPILGGIGFGLCALCRPSLLPAAGLTSVAAIMVYPGIRRDRLVKALTLAAATVVTLVPWAARNVGAVGEPVWTTTHGGYTLWLANNPAYYGDVLDAADDSVWSGPNQERWFASIGEQTRGMTEPQADRRLRKLALDLARERPLDFWRASISRLARFWGISPSPAVYPRSIRVATALWTLPFWIAVLAGLCRRSAWTWPEVAAPAFLLGLTAVHAFYWTDLRMRAPLVPALALMASLALSRGPESRAVADVGEIDMPNSRASQG